MITWYCPGCREPEWSRYGAEARDLIAHHKQHCPDYRGHQLFKGENSMSKPKHPETTDNMRHTYAINTSIDYEDDDDQAYDEAEHRFDYWLNEVKADAWDEGQVSGISFQAGGEYLENPYRGGQR